MEEGANTGIRKDGGSKAMQDGEVWSPLPMDFDSGIYTEIFYGMWRIIGAIKSVPRKSTNSG
jgi:hypothetical protein